MSTSTQTSQKQSSLHIKNKRRSEKTSVVFDDIHIIGCGSIGGNLAISIIQAGITKRVHVYDSDIVTANNNYFPFDGRLGTKKIDIIKEFETVKTKVHCYESIHETHRFPYSLNRILSIDCRDTIHPRIVCNMKVAVSSDILQIDSRLQKSVVLDYQLYSNGMCTIRRGVIVSFLLDFIYNKFYKIPNLYVFKWRIDGFTTFRQSQMFTDINELKNIIYDQKTVFNIYINNKFAPSNCLIRNRIFKQDKLDDEFIKQIKTSILNKYNGNNTEISDDIRNQIFNLLYHVYYMKRNRIQILITRFGGSA